MSPPLPLSISILACASLVLCGCYAVPAREDAGASEGCSSSWLALDDGGCAPRRENGESCSAEDDCLSGHCVTGVCCSSSCPAGCGSCVSDAGVGVCRRVGDAGCGTLLADGDSCLDNGQCLSGFCRDGRCCASACTGACRACDAAGLEGTCSLFAARSDPDGECGGGLCNGAGGCGPCGSSLDCKSGHYCWGAQCLPLKAVGTNCSQGFECQSGACNARCCKLSDCAGICRECNGMGDCTLARAKDADPACLPYTCNGDGGCFTGCSNDGPCAPGHCCSGGACIPRPDGGC